MREEDKGTVISQLTETLKRYPNFYLAGTETLDVEKISKSRRECFGRGVKLAAVKDSLFRKALEDTEGDFSDLNVALKGNMAVTFSQVTNAPARPTKDFTEDAKKDVVVRPVLKVTYAQEGFYVGAENPEALANIKNRSELIVDTIALLKSPAKNVISALLSSGQTIHGLLKTLEGR